MLCAKSCTVTGRVFHVAGPEAGKLRGPYHTSRFRGKLFCQWRIQKIVLGGEGGMGGCARQRRAGGRAPTGCQGAKPPSEAGVLIHSE